VWSTDRSGTAGAPAALPSGAASLPPGTVRAARGAGRVTVVSAPAGSGETLLRSWTGEAGLAERAGWVPMQGEERDPQQFWLSVLGALRARPPGRSWSGP
jgi:hypothetical protein